MHNLDTNIVLINCLTVGRSYYFRINGEPVFIKGSNWIPSTVLPELETEDNIRKILTSVKKAHMNALRIWGGGMYEFNEFYRVYYIIDLE